MKKILFSLFLVLTLLLVPLQVLAQEEEAVTSTGGTSFELSIVPGVQSIFDKSIPLTLNITSKVDTHRMQLRWELPTGISAKNSGVTDWGTVTKGQEISTSITLKPAKLGTYNIVAEVQDWRTNEVDTVAIEITFDKNLELSPQSDEYYRNKTAWFWAKVGIGIVGVTALIIFTVLGIKAFQKWMDED